VGVALPAISFLFMLYTLDSRINTATGKGGPGRAVFRRRKRHEPAGELRSGKGHRDENFPVASRLIDARHRGIILAFYEFVRVADDIADHATAARRREARPARPAGSRSAWATATPIRRRCGCELKLAERGLPPRHAQDLLTAFRMDVTKLRYRDWGRSHSLLQLLGDAGRPLRARCARREPFHVEGERCALRASADQQHLQDCGKGFPRSQSRYIPARCIRGGGLPRPRSSVHAVPRQNS
jgi:hypothetical protein